MDAKITKKRLNILLSYDWIKIILTAVAVILVWSLLFTMTATRATQAQVFTIFNYTGTTATDRFSNYASLQGGDVFSYDILEVTPTDITTGGDYSDTLIQTRLSTGEGDALFAANSNEGVETEYARPDGTTYHPTYLEQFLSGYFSAAEDLGNGDGTGGFFQDMAEYLNGYYHGDYTKGDADEEKIEADFYARLDGLNDKRFKSAAEKRAGLEQEKARLEKQRTDLIDFLSYLDAGYVSLQQTTLYFQGSDGEPMTVTGYYSINLCPDDRMDDLRRDVYYYAESGSSDSQDDSAAGSSSDTSDGASDSAGGSASDSSEGSGDPPVRTARDICLVLLNVAEDRYQYARFESLCFVNYLIETHCSALQAD
ncbi:MAG TPA: hypothetical protein IAB32_04315 [Candidatus Scatosoma pullicola]|nr:hypothetical protein [Candidatus Scatosoma pullicola]